VLPDTDIRQESPGVLARWELVPPALRETLLQAFRDWAFPIYMFGPPGRGKTSAAACCYRSAVCRSQFITCLEFVRLVQQCRTSEDHRCYALNPEYGHSETQLWEQFVNGKVDFGWKPERATVDLLVVDDIGIRTPSDSVFGIVYELIDRRGRRPTILTGNLEPEDLYSVFDGRVASRILSGTTIKVTGTDRRLEGKKIIEV
jgi:DNA replication protein DnaC